MSVGLDAKVSGSYDLVCAIKPLARILARSESAAEMKVRTIRATRPADSKSTSIKEAYCNGNKRLAVFLRNQ